MKKLLAIASVLAVLVPGSILAQPAQTPTVRQAPHAPGALKAPEVRLKDNTALPIDKLVPQEKIVGRLTKKATLKSIQLIKYSQHQAERAKIAGVAFENPEISGNRQIYKIVLEFPQGFTIPRAGKFDRATVTSIIDAETGESIDTDIDAPPGAFHSFHDGLSVGNPNNR
jgi:hypothetical protein